MSIMNEASVYSAALQLTVLSEPKVDAPLAFSICDIHTIIAAGSVWVSWPAIYVLVLGV